MGELVTIGDRAGPERASEAQGRHLRRARRRPQLGRVLPRRRPRLRVLLALPRADRRGSPRRGRRWRRRRSAGPRPRDRIRGPGPHLRKDLDGGPGAAGGGSAGGFRRTYRRRRVECRCPGAPERGNPGPRRAGPSRRARLHRLARSHDDGRVEPPRGRPAAHEGPGRFHPAARRLRQNPVGRPVVDRRRMGSRAVGPAEPADQRAARLRCRRPADLPLRGRTAT